MPDYITIKHESFTATLDVAAIDKLTLTQWRGLVRLAADSLWDNAQAINTAIEVLKEALYEADQVWKAASREYVDGFREPKFIQWKRDKDKAEANNKKLLAAVKSAKHKKDFWEKRLGTITDRVPADQLNYCLRAQN